VCVFCFHGGGGFPVKLVLYSLLCNLFLMLFISVSFTFLVVEYLCNRFNRYLMPDSLCLYG
jgi:hypothetical protein